MSIIKFKSVIIKSNRKLNNNNNNNKKMRKEKEDLAKRTRRIDCTGLPMRHHRTIENLIYVPTPTVPQIISLSLLSLLLLL